MAILTTLLVASYCVASAFRYSRRQRWPGSPMSWKDSDSPLHEFAGEWIRDLLKSWLDFKSYLAQRRKLLADPELLTVPQFPGPKDIPPLKFATQSVILVTAVSALVVWTDKIVFREPRPSPTELVNSSAGRIANVEDNLRFFLDVGPPPDDKDTDEIAKSILHAPANEGLQLNELQAVLEFQKRTVQGLPTPASRIRDARIEVLEGVRDARIQLVKAQHLVEPDIGLSGQIVVNLQNFVDEQLKALTYNEASDKVTNVGEVEQKLINARELADLTSGFLGGFVDAEKVDADYNRKVELARAQAGIKVLNRAIVLSKEENKQDETTKERYRQISEYLSPVLPPITMIFSAFLFRRFIKVGRHRPSRNLDKAQTAYLYLFTSAFLWLNVFYAIGVIAMIDFCKHSSPGLKWCLPASVVAIFAYIAWACATLYTISNKLERFFGMERQKHPWQLYCGKRKIALDLIAANALGSAAISVLVLILVIAYLHLGEIAA